MKILQKLNMSIGAICYHLAAKPSQNVFLERPLGPGPGPDSRLPVVYQSSTSRLPVVPPNSPPGTRTFVPPNSPPWRCALFRKALRLDVHFFKRHFASMCTSLGAGGLLAVRTSLSSAHLSPFPAHPPPAAQGRGRRLRSLGKFAKLR